MHSLSLPTPLAKVTARQQLAETGAPTTRFLTLSYVFEAFLKCLTASLIASITEINRDLSYRLIHSLLRADGLGTWDQAISTCSRPPYSGYIPLDMRPLLVWCTTRKRGENRERYESAWITIGNALARVGLPLDKRSSVSNRDLLVALIQLRNKTKAHGALGESDFEEIIPGFSETLHLLLETCPICSMSWLYFEKHTEPRRSQLVQLESATPHAVPLEFGGARVSETGIYITNLGAKSAYKIPPLILSSPELRDFHFANGGLRQGDQTFEFVSYASADVKRVSLPGFLRDPAPLPKSETEGLSSLDVQSSLFGNLPNFPSGFVKRPRLEGELSARLMDRNHPVITLHGKGGIGKTSLALYTSHSLASAERSPFDAIVWLSARDVDLTLSGPRSVRQDVLSLTDIARRVCTLFSIEPTTDNLALLLEEPWSSGTLFILDNFETLDNVVEIHRFFDEHTYIPNKTLITSRERAFKADYPIEVLGMEEDEARTLASQISRSLGIEGLLTDQVFWRMYEATSGHPYLIKLIIGEIAKEGKYIPPSKILANRDDVVDSLFERSFNRLSIDGRAIFLVVANCRYLVPEFALTAILAQRNIDSVKGIDECVRQSLLESQVGGDEVRYVQAPQIARVFGAKKLRGDPDRPLLEADLQLLSRFGAIGIESTSTTTHQELISRFFNRLRANSNTSDSEQVSQLEHIFHALAEAWPYAWQPLARFRQEFGYAKDAVAYAYRRAMEENPFDSSVIEERAEYARSIGDHFTEVSCYIQLVELMPRDVELLVHVAAVLANFVTTQKTKFPEHSRGMFIASVRQRLAEVAGELDAAGLSRLAWLYLQEGSREEAQYYAMEGYKKDKYNVHCSRLLERLKAL